MSRLDERMAQLEAENDNLRQKIALLEQTLLEFQEQRYIPRKHAWEVPKWAVDSCGKCGITLHKHMCYSCPDGNCPCGLGSVVS